MPKGYRFASVVGLLVVATGLGACGSSADDEDRFTDQYALGELNASYGAFADEAALKVYAAVLTPKGFGRLRSGDTFEVDVNGVRMATNERVLEDRIHYIVEMPPPPGDTEVVIAFVRGPERVVGKIKLTATFAIKSPPSVKAGESAELDIEPRPDLSKWPGFFGPSLIAKAQVIGPCIETGGQQIPLCAVKSPVGKCEQGYPMRLDTAKLLQLPGATGCELGVQVRLNSNASPFEGTGPAKQTFKGGGFEGYRLTNFRFLMTPP